MRRPSIAVRLGLALFAFAAIVGYAVSTPDPRDDFVAIFGGALLVALVFWDELAE